MIPFGNKLYDFLGRHLTPRVPTKAAAGDRNPGYSGQSGGSRRLSPAQLDNRSTFQQIAAQRLAENMPCAVLLFDIDGLAEINDQFGYAMGDSLLEQFGERLRNQVPLACCAAHFFSDEFALLVALNDAPGDVESIALRCMRAMDLPFIVGNDALCISVSIGIASASQCEQSGAALISAASRALRAAKAAGGRVWRIFSDAMLDDAGELRRDLSFAIANREIIPYYQPIVELASGHVVGLEVLARWNHPKRGLLWPNQFIKLAERDGRLSGITTTLLHQVAEDAVGWRNELFFAFNIAPAQIRELADYVFLPPAPPTTALPLHRIEIELSETALIEDLDATCHMVDLLQERGARVALNDFGGGNANFRHLRGIPFDRLKVDREFVRDMLDDPRAGICVHSIAEVGHQLDIDVTAEGITTLEIATRVRALGCRFGQGSLFSMPVPAVAVTALLAKLADAAARGIVVALPGASLD
jgi:diguanylate cyclase (GGDEF)-like protein